MVIVSCQIQIKVNNKSVDRMAHVNNRFSFKNTAKFQILTKINTWFYLTFKNLNYNLNHNK